MNRVFSSDEKIGICDLMIALYFFLSFFEPYFSGAIGSITRYYIFIVMMVVIYKNEFKIKKYRYVMMFAFWLVYKFFSLLWTSNYTVFNQHVVTTVGMIGFLVVLSSYTSTKALLKLILIAEWLGSFTIGVLAIFNSVPFLGRFNERMVLQLFGQTLDPNNEAAFLAIAVAISLYMVIVRKKNVLINSIVILINTYSSFITGSRGGLLTLGCLIISLVLIAKKNASFKITLLFATPIIIFISYYLAKMYLPKEIFYRLFTFSTYEGGSTRTDLWNVARDLIKENLNFFFGAGWGAYYGYQGIDGTLHNTFISMLCDVGVFGSLIFWQPIVSTCKKMINSQNSLPVMLIIAGLVPSFFIEAINKRFFWNSIFFLFLFYNYVRNNLVDYETGELREMEI